MACFQRLSVARQEACGHCLCVIVGPLSNKQKQQKSKMRTYSFKVPIIETDSGLESERRGILHVLISM